MRPGHRSSLAAALALLLGCTMLPGQSREEMERYGFSRRLSETVDLESLRPIPDPQPRRVLPPGPLLPDRQRTPSAAIPSPTRPRQAIDLRPTGGGGRIGTGPNPSGPGPLPSSDPLIARLFPGQVRSRYVGDAACLKCHTSKGHDQAHSLYGLIRTNKGVPEERRSCEGCHGPGQEHATRLRPITNPAKLDHLAVSDLCLSCHADSRRVKRLEWHVTGHQEGFVSCTTCHSVHAPRWKKSLTKEPDGLCLSCHQDQAARFKLRSRHPVKREGSDALSSQREGKVRCIDCHQVYSTRNGADLMRREGKESCTRCHGETRGPFLFEHDPVSGDLANQCSTCHMPHGSPNRDLLVLPGRSLCLRCHTDRVSHRPGPSCFNAQCHRDIHGSNLNRLFLPR